MGVHNRLPWLFNMGYHDKVWEKEWQTTNSCSRNLLSRTVTGMARKESELKVLQFQYFSPVAGKDRTKIFLSSMNY